KGYTEAMAPVSDYMVYNPYINFKGSMTLKEGFVCQYPWERIMIAFNGKVQPCTGWNAQDIVVGNLAEKSIRELWHCQAMQNIRRKHAQGKRMELSSCAECRHGSKGDSDVSIETILEREY
ncbi:MAG: SPASM domain-containing protein, partial [Planctomycetes bacterium]|nr:SPASM domain-containing protein [Planctomycetota bacterium]